jgi:hypothetical protein
MWEPNGWRAEAQSRAIDPEYHEVYVPEWELEVGLPWLTLPDVVPK